MTKVAQKQNLFAQFGANAQGTTVRQMSQAAQRQVETVIADYNNQYSTNLRVRKSPSVRLTDDVATADTMPKASFVVYKPSPLTAFKTWLNSEVPRSAVVARIHAKPNYAGTPGLSDDVMLVGKEKAYRSTVEKDFPAGISKSDSPERNLAALLLKARTDKNLG